MFARLAGRLKAFFADSIRTPWRSRWEFEKEYKKRKEESHKEAQKAQEAQLPPRRREEDGRHWQFEPGWGSVLFDSGSDRFANFTQNLRTLCTKEGGVAD
jgi:hypothetical protein